MKEKHSSIIIERATGWTTSMHNRSHQTEQFIMSERNL